MGYAEEILKEYERITEDDMNEITIDEINPERVTEPYRLGIRLKAEKAASYA